MKLLSRRTLFFNFQNDSTLTVVLFSDAKHTRTETITPLRTLSETLWSILPRLLDGIDAPAIDACAVRYRNGAVPYSRLRTILSVMNTCGVIFSIPLIRVPERITYERRILEYIEKQITQHAHSFVVEAVYE